MKFKPLIPSDYPDLKPFFQNQKYRLCAYSLASVLAWSNKEYQPFGAITDDALIVSAEFNTKKGNRHLLLPVSPTRDYCPEELRDLAVKLGFESYWFVPGYYIEGYGKDRVASLFNVTEQKELHDYIYRTEDLATLKGNKYSKKRNLIHQFNKKYLNNGNVLVEPMTPSAKTECIEFMEKWCEERNCSMDEDEDLACEKQAFINTVEYLDIMEVNGILLRINGEVSAFAITSHLTDDMGVLQFEKALVKVKGLYQYLDNICAKNLLKGYKLTNKESDMSVPGLARAKKSYHPVMMVKSYKMTVI